MVTPHEVLSWWTVRPVAMPFDVSQALGRANELVSCTSPLASSGGVVFCISSVYRSQLALVYDYEQCWPSSGIMTALIQPMKRIANVRFAKTSLTCLMTKLLTATD